MITMSLLTSLILLFRLQFTVHNLHYYSNVLVFFSSAKSIQNEISPVLSTFLVGIFTFMHEYKKRQLPKWLCKCEHVVDIYPIDPSSVIVNLNCMEEILTIQFDFPMETFSQMGILRTKCTPYIRDLELGKNLTQCVDCILQSLY